MKFNETDIKILLFTILFLSGQYLINRTPKVEIEQNGNERFNNFLIQENTVLKERNSKLNLKYEKLQTQIEQDSVFIYNVGRDSLREIANEY